MKITKEDLGKAIEAKTKSCRACAGTGIMYQYKVKIGPRIRHKKCPQCKGRGEKECTGSSKATASTSRGLLT